MKFFPRLPFFFLLVLAPYAAFAQTSTSVSAFADSNIQKATYNTRLRLKFDPRSIVAGSPASYEQVDDTSRTLADGTRITEKTVTSFFYRDSSGRTRKESQMFGHSGVNSGLGNLKLIEIRDPVANVQYVLDTNHHVAYRLPFAASLPEASSLAPAQPKPVSAVTDKPKLERTRESLGIQAMEGVSVEGNRTTTVFPVGSVNNDRPITRTCETWYSRELGETVLFKCSDLLNGDFVYRLTNTSLAEPDPMLFQVPADYQIVDGPADGHVTLKFEVPER